jgi:glycosyltransferase involved in cell wall biosynthesis
MDQFPSYVIVTPARNEARFMELTVKSVIAQSILPNRWIVVNDGSTDETGEIVKRYSSQYPWIELVDIPGHENRDFASKVFAFDAGYARVRDVDFDVIVSLDADISFDSNFFAFLLGKLSADPALGLVGVPFQEPSGRSYDYRFVSREHVSGFCQVFRRKCFEAIGGYVPVKGGSIDHIAVISARMMGWKTWTFTEKVAIHHRPIGLGHGKALSSRFRQGIKDYRIGNHPLWELFRVGYQMISRPWCIGGLAVGAGYFWALLRRVDRPVSREFINFHRREQIQRLAKFLSFSRVSSAEC